MIEDIYIIAISMVVLLALILISSVIAKLFNYFEPNIVNDNVISLAKERYKRNNVKSIKYYRKRK